jgi:hypothetical protein
MNLPKLALRWVDPCRILQVLTAIIFVFTSSRHWRGNCEVRGRRVLFFRDSRYKVTREGSEQLEEQTGELQAVSALVGVRVWQGAFSAYLSGRGEEVYLRWRRERAQG